MDIDYNGLFGIDGGGNEQEVAAPAKNSADENAASGDQAEGAAERTGEAQGGTEPPKGQSADQNARFAAARRKAEQERDAAIAQAKREALEAAQRTIDEAFANSGLTNPYTKQPIQSKAEWDEYMARYQAEQKAGFQKKAGMSDEEFRRFVDGLPEVQQAKQAKAQAEQTQREAQEARAKAKVDEQLREIGKLDPSIKSLEDLAKMPSYPQFYELVKKGNTLTDAFRLANFDALTRREAEASRQAAINAANGKNHMTQTQARGQGTVSVPAEVAEQYRLFNPDATDAEIQAHYSKYHKK